MKRLDKKHRRWGLKAAVVALAVILVNQLAVLSAVPTYKASITPGGEEKVSVHVMLDVGRPRGLLDRVFRALRLRGLRLPWIGSWLVGGEEVSDATTSISITVTGSNVEGTAYVTYYVEARETGSQGTPYRVLEASDVSATVGGSALENSTVESIPDHLEAMGLSTDQDWTIDYYIYTKVEATGAISGDTLTSTIPETLFDTVEYVYSPPLGDPVEKVYNQQGTTYVRDGDQHFDAYYSMLLCLDYSTTYRDYHSSIRYIVDIPEGAVIQDARIEFVAESTTSPVYENRLYGEAADNPVAPTSYSDFQSRPLTTEYGYGNEPGYQWQKWKYHNSSDLSLVLQEVIDRPGYESGNAVQFFWRDPVSGCPHGDILLYAGNNPKLYVTYATYGASFQPLPPLSLTAMPITWDVVAVLSLIGATVLVLRKEGEET